MRLVSLYPQSNSCAEYDQDTRMDLLRTCQMHSRAPSKVPSDQLPEVVSGRLLPEPVHEPARLVSHQDHLVLWAHPLLSNPGKVPGAGYTARLGSSSAAGTEGETRPSESAPSSKAALRDT